MTINYARESVIDFTKPFMNMGISIMFKVPSRQPSRLFSFMKPLTLDIWLYVLFAYALVSLTMFVTRSARTFIISFFYLMCALVWIRNCFIPETRNPPLLII